MELYWKKIKSVVMSHHHLIPSPLAISGTERTLLCMWMVYSRATTSAMAERCCVFFPFVADMVGCVRVGG